MAQEVSIAASLQVAENFGGKSFNPGAMSPCIARQTGLQAGLFQKDSSVPAMLRRNLRQQQSASSAVRDHQAVRANLDFLGCNRCQLRQYAQRAFYLAGLRQRERR